jgi:sugar lactone lactonase YvrE
MRRIFVCLILAASLHGQPDYPYIITTAAGSGPGGNGEPATAGRLMSPGAVVCDTTGSCYVADCGGHRVCRINPDGTMVTVAGTGIPGDLGDGGPALAATLAYPSGLALDGAGNLYIATASRIRKVSADGTISTFAGKGEWTNLPGLEGLPRLDVKMAGPEGLAADASGNVYYTDWWRVRKVGAADGLVRTVVGGGLSEPDAPTATGLRLLATPGGIALDGDGNLYLADAEKCAECGAGRSGHWNRILRIEPSGKYTVVAGGAMDYHDTGTATLSSVAAANGLAVDAANNVYIAETGFSSAPGWRVRKVAGRNIATVAGAGIGFAGDGGPAAAARLNTASRCRRP